MQITISINTKEKQQFVDVTSHVQKFVEDSKIDAGICHVFTPHATAAIGVNENADPNIASDFFVALNKMIIPNDNYLHDKIDNNAAAHIAAIIIGPSETFPVKDGKLVLGTWQNVFLIELDGGRKRKVIIDLIKGQVK